MSCTENIALSRRRLLQGSAASLALWGFMPRALGAASKDPRLLTIVLRGGVDGLSVAAPVGDPDYQRLRQHIALEASKGLALDSFFALNPNLAFLHGLYQKKQALIAHAMHTTYRERSHFDAQDVLEAGSPGGKTSDGWLNRALLGMSVEGKASPKGLVTDAVVPLVMRGKAEVLSWIPKVYNSPLRESTVARLMDLYAQTDPGLAKAFAQGMEIDRATTTGMVGAGAKAEATGSRAMKDFVEAAEAAATFMSKPDGPRIGALSFNGWDTHANEGVLQGQLGGRLQGLDQALKAFHDGMGPIWKDTAVVIITEFGRTAAVNGTDGTDHGMATTAMVLGGSINGGRVLADWPGLADANLYERRDLKPTADLRGLLKGVLRDHLGVPAGALGKAVFPDSQTVKPIDGLVA